MNCKQGDMAIIVKSHAGNEGKVVTCLELLGNPGYYDYNGFHFRFTAGTWWRVDVLLGVVCGSKAAGYSEVISDFMPFVRDECLMPIGSQALTEDTKIEESL